MKMRNGTRRISCLLGVVLLLLTVSVANAQDERPEQGTDECTGCHEGLRHYWEDSAHASALSDPVFQEGWQAQGSPPECLQCHTTGFDPATAAYTEEGVACLTCHSPVPANHPDDMIPTDISSRLCGDCHVETFNQWELSGHAQEDLNCNNCHNAHTTELRAEHSQELCQTCHEAESHRYAMTAHAQEGLLCTDCHLRVDAEAPLGEGHGQRSHTFGVDLATCNECHANEMHAGEVGMVSFGTAEEAVSCYPAQVVEAQVNAPTSVEQHAVDDTPHGPSPLVYIVPAGFGVVFGSLMAPWVERRVRGDKNKGDK